MKKMKQWVFLGIGTLLVLFVIVSLLIPYPKEEKRETINRVYESNMKMGQDVQKNFILLQAFEAEVNLKEEEEEETTKSNTQELKSILQNEDVMNHNIIAKDTKDSKNVKDSENTKDSKNAKDSESLKESKDIKDTITIKKGIKATWEFTVETTGDYFIRAGYFLLEGNGQDLEAKIQVDGKEIAEDKNATLTRLWSDSGNFVLTASGDESKPEQQTISLWAEENMKWNGSQDIILSLEAGTHTISITGIREEGLIQYIKLYTKETKTYEEYLEETSQFVSSLSDVSAQFDKSNVSAQFTKPDVIKIQAETPYMKSSSLLYPIYDRSSAYTTPYHSTAIRYNTIGGSNWSKDGQWIEWKINVEEDGYYQIGMRYRQNGAKGVTSARRVLIDGEVLFDELEQVNFPYDAGWQTDFLGFDKPYHFYLAKGEHTLRLEVALLELTDITEKMDATVYALNALYREIIIITGTEPDMYRDYHLETTVPELETKLQRLVDELKGYEDYLEERYGANSYASRIVSQLKRQLESFIKQPYTIQKRLSMFKTNISAMAEWVLELKEQPLELDCFYLTQIGAKLPKADTNLFGKAGHELRSFFGSFFHNYSELSSTAEGKEEVTIQVWLGKGRDQANVIKRLVDEYFTKETGIRVNISLVEGALVKAAIAGQGPDVNLFTTRGEAMNLAFRGALDALDKMEGFSELKTQYMENAFVPYTYEDTVYAIPEEQIFYMMFIRTDVFEELGIEIPKTWTDVMEIMPILQAANLGIGLPYTDGYATMNSGIGTINLLPTLLAQNRISIYNEDNTRIQLTDSKAYQSFKMWTDFYTMYDFDLYKDDFNRFRTGEMPIVISPYTLYNNLAKAAPEIAGQWTMTTVPGTMNSSNDINIATSASGSCSIILKGCKEKEAAWKFVHWWNSAQTQEKYSKEIEAELSVLGRYSPANLEAFSHTNWYAEEKEILLKQWSSVVEIPEIPGGYYTSRNIDNAFRDVYYNGENARESLYTWMNGVNEELERKQKQIRKRNQTKNSNSEKENIKDLQEDGKNTGGE